MGMESAFAVPFSHSSLHQLGGDSLSICQNGSSKYFKQYLQFFDSELPYDAPRETICSSITEVSTSQSPVFHYLNGAQSYHYF